MSTRKIISARRCPSLRGVDRQRHRQAAGDQDGGVDRAEPRRRSWRLPAANASGYQWPVDEHSQRTGRRRTAPRWRGTPTCRASRPRAAARGRRTGARAHRRCCVRHQATWCSAGRRTSYASSVTTGVSAKFSVGGGDGVCPLEAGRAPRIRAGDAAVAQRPDQIDQRDAGSRRRESTRRPSTSRSAPGTPAGTRDSAAACRDSRG